MLTRSGSQKLTEPDPAWLNNRFRLLFENLSQAAAFFLKENGTLNVYNPAFMKLTGFSETELEGKKFYDFVHPLDLPAVQEHLLTILHQQKLHEIFEIRILNKTKEIFFVEVTLLSHFLDQQLQGIEVFLRDITPRKNAEQALIRQNKELKVLNTIADVISQTLSLEEILQNSLGIILNTLEFQAGVVSVLDYAEQKFTRFISAGDFSSELQHFIDVEYEHILKNYQSLPQSVWTFQLRADADSPSEGMGDMLRRTGFKSGAIVLLRSKEKLQGVLILWRRELSQFDRSDLKLLMTIGGQVGMAIENSWLYEKTDSKLQARVKELAALNAVSSAISQTISLEVRLELALQNILKVMELEAGTIYVVDAKTRIAQLKTRQGVSEKFIKRFNNFYLNQELLEYCESERLVIDSLSDPAWIEALNFQPVAPYPRLLSVFLRSKENFLGLCHIFIPENRKISKNEIRLLESIGRQIGVAIENSQLFEEAQVRQAELAEINKELQNFIYLISHDLKTPVISIQGLIDIFLAELSQPLEANTKKYITAIQESANRMESLIHDLLEFSRISQTPLNLEVTDTRETILEIMHELEFKAREYQVQIRCHHQFPTVYCDRNRFKMVLENLVDNAIQYSRRDSGAFVQLNFTEQKNRWIFCVADNGVGIPEKYFDRIFNLFERLTRTPPGSGLGLAIAQRVIKLHGGEIWLESEEGRGSKFYFSLPKS